MQQYVNQGYWEPTSEYSAGSQIKINDDASVEFHNIMSYIDYLANHQVLK